jgi:hypothetical protein
LKISFAADQRVSSTSTPRKDPQREHLPARLDVVDQELGRVSAERIAADRVDERDRAVRVDAAVEHDHRQVLLARRLDGRRERRGGVRRHDQRVALAARDHRLDVGDLLVVLGLGVDRREVGDLLVELDLLLHRLPADLTPRVVDRGVREADVEAAAPARLVLAGVDPLGAPGTYTARVTVTDQRGAKGTAEVVVTVRE